MMKRLTVLLLTCCMVLTMSAQTAREEIKANKFLSASNYLDYDNYPATKPLTPAPKGYEPYLMNHYGRHGSRWLINEHRILVFLIRSARLASREN